MKTNGKIKVVLASASPRRRELLRRIVEDFTVIASHTDETLPTGFSLKEGVRILAERKGASVSGTLPDDRMVISSDTLVELDGVPLGKPIDKSDAVRMLTRMSGKIHYVHTGIAVHYRGKSLSEVATASVKFREISRSEIESYVDGGEPMDKAGSYGIQGEGGKFVEEYHGDFDTIMGLSVSLTEELMERIRLLCDE